MLPLCQVLPVGGVVAVRVRGFISRNRFQGILCIWYIELCMERFFSNSMDLCLYLKDPENSVDSQ